MIAPAPVKTRTLRGHLLRLLLPPVAAMLALGTVLVYLSALEPATEAYDQALIDVAIALGERIHPAGDGYAFELPGAAEQVLRTDKYDDIYYRVRTPDGRVLAGDAGLPMPPPGAVAEDGVIAFDGVYRDRPVRIASLLIPCAGRICTVDVAETTIKRERLRREIALWSLLPDIAIAAITLIIVWFGVARGLAPLAKLSEELAARPANDLRPVDASQAPEEARPLVEAMNRLLEQSAEASRNQQRFLANAAHQLRTPLAGLQAHSELALSMDLPAAARAGLAEVHKATVRTGRLATQLLALARAESGGRPGSERGRVDLRALADEAADAWVHLALAREVDLGFDLDTAFVEGDAVLLGEAFANLVHNAIEYAPAGGHVTARTGTHRARAFLAVEDDGPGIPAAERERVLERFYRLNDSRGTGSGLGLAIVREIAHAHGAKIEITDALPAGPERRGTRITLRFPGGNAAAPDAGTA